MDIEISSFFYQEWQKSDIEQFVKSVNPKEGELPELLEALKNGEQILSAIGSLKFRVTPPNKPNLLIWWRSMARKIKL